MNIPEVKCPKCGAAQLAANKQINVSVPSATAAGDTDVLTRRPRSKKATVMCRHCGFRFKAGDRLRGLAPMHAKETPAEKKVSRFMTKFFGIALAAIIVLLVYLWAIGKFG